MAIIRGKTAIEREETRPVLDKAFIVEGLDEIPMDERRGKMEKAGICWFCGACGDCKSCGTGDRKRSVEEPADRKGKGRMVDAEIGQGRNKRVRFERAGGSMPTLTSVFSASSLTVPDLSTYPTQPFEQQPLDPALKQYDPNLGGFVFGQFDQPAPTFSYQNREMSFQFPKPQDPSGSWQGAQGLPNYGVSCKQAGSVSIDPSLERSQAGAECNQLFDFTLSGNDELPPIPDSGTDLVSLPLLD